MFFDINIIKVLYECSEKPTANKQHSMPFDLLIQQRANSSSNTGTKSQQSQRNGIRRRDIRIILQHTKKTKHLFEIFFLQQKTISAPKIFPPIKHQILTPHNNVVFERVPPIKLEYAMLMDWICPFLDNEIDSKISGASLAMGAKKNAKSIGLT